MKKLNPKKVFIIADGGYREITPEEHEFRKETDAGYREKKFIGLHSMIMEVSEKDNGYRIVGSAFTKEPSDKQNTEVLKTLKLHIGMGLTDETTEDKTLDIQIRIAELDAEFQKMLKAVSADNADAIDEERIAELMSEKHRLTVQLEQYAAMRQKRESAKSRLDEIYTILDGLQNHPMEYDDKLVRQIIECVVVESKEKIKVVFIGGTEIEMAL